jgi:hypothetical protein
MLASTLLLVTAACVLWVTGSVGVAQLFLVLASGTAGATVALFVDHWEDR